jgi:hypothetical protein
MRLRRHYSNPEIRQAIEELRQHIADGRNSFP